MRLVLDTTILVAAIRSDKGASRRLLLAGLEQRVTLLVSVPLLIEYQGVMSRSEHLEASGLTDADVSTILDAVTATADPVHLAFLWRPFARDADDDMIVETAVNGRANAIVTFNQRDFAGVTETFGIAILAPAEAVRLMETKA